MKLVYGLIAVVGVLAVVEAKPALHYLKANYGEWGYGAGMPAIIAATGGMLWIGAKLRVATLKKQAAIDRQRFKP